MFKFAVEFALEKVNGEMEFSEFSVMGERPWIQDVLDSDTLQSDIEDYEYLTELPDGLYHVFATGVTNWWTVYTPDGDEQDYSVECEYINAYKMEGDNATDVKMNGLEEG